MNLLVDHHHGDQPNVLRIGSGGIGMKLRPPRAPTSYAVLHNLVAARGLSYRAIPQEGEHALVCTRAVVDAAYAFLE